MVKKKIILTALIIALITPLLTVTGCSRDAKTGYTGTMDLRDAFKGERTVDIPVGSSFLSDYFDNDEDKLSEFLDKAPEGVDASYSNGGNMINLYIRFDSLDQYREAIDGLIGESFRERKGFRPYVYFDRYNNAFKKGFTYKENFSNEDMVYWLYHQLKKEGLLDEEAEFSDMFEDGGSYLYVGGKEIAMDSPYISYTSVADHYINAIDIQTEIKDSGYDVSVSFRGDSEKLTSMGRTLTKKLRDSVPTGGNIVSVTDENVKSYTISFTASGVEEYTQKLNTVLSSKNSYAALIESGTDQSQSEEEIDENADDSSSNDLRASKGLTVYADCSYYLDFADPGSSLTYTVLASPDYTVDSITSDYGSVEERDYEYTDEYCIVTAKTGVPDPFGVSFSFSVAIKGITVDTVVNGEKSLDRDITFTLSMDEYKLIGQQFENRIRNLLTEGLEYEKITGERTVDFKIHLEAGSAEELGNLTSEFLGGSDDNIQSSFSGGKDKGRNLRNITYSFQDSINFTNVLGGSQITDGILYRMSFPGGFAASFQNSDGLEEPATDGNDLSCITFNKSISVNSRGSRINVSGWFIMIIWIISFMGFLVLTFINRKRIGAIIKNKENRWAALDVKTKRQYRGLGIYVTVAVIFVFMTARLIFGVY